jgi:hypothetical protein
MNEIPPHISTDLADVICGDPQLVGATLNERRSAAHHILALIEQHANSKGLPEVRPERLANELAPLFKGSDSKIKKKRALTAVNRVMREIRERLKEGPQGYWDFATFLRNYKLTKGDPVPFAEGIKIITAQDRSYHLKRARTKFDKLSNQLIEEQRKSFDPENVQILRSLPGYLLNENPDEDSTKKFYDRLQPSHYPKADQKIPEDFFFRAEDVWHLWREVREREITRTREKNFPAV